MRRHAWPSALGLALACAVLGLSARAACAFILVPTWEERAGVATTPDAYPELARSLLERRELGYGHGPTTARGPGFPAWLALGLSLGLGDARALGLWGALPGLLVGSLLAGLALRHSGLVAGIITGGVAVLHPLPVLSGARVMGDDFYAALGAAGLLLTWLSLRAAGPWRGRVAAGGAGLCFGAQILARATGVLTLLAATVWSAARRHPARGLALAVLALLFPLAWSWRASRLEGRPVFVHSLLFYNYWIGEGLDRLGSGPPPAGHWGLIVRETFERGGIPAERARTLWYGELAPRELAALERRLGAAALSEARAHPGHLAARTVRGLLAYWVRGATGERTWQYAALVLPLVALGACGTWRACRAGAGDAGLGLLLASALALHLATGALILPAARLSVQVYPELAYLAGLGASWLFGLVGRRPRS